MSPSSPLGPRAATGWAYAARGKYGCKGMNRQMDGQSDVRQIPLVDNEIQSSDLFKYGKELSIVHNNEVYKLRLTGNSKLILTK